MGDLFVNILQAVKLSTIEIKGLRISYNAKGAFQCCLHEDQYLSAVENDAIIFQY